MTDAKSAVLFRGEAEVGIVRSSSGSCGIASSWDARAVAIARALFAAASWRAKASLSSRFRDRRMSCGLLPRAKYSQRRNGSSRLASRSFRGIIFSIPTASTVVAYNISRHINIPEGRWAVRSAGQPRTNRAAGTSAQWRRLSSVSATRVNRETSEDHWKKRTTADL